MLRGTAEEEGEIWFCYCRCFFNPSVLLTPPSFGHLPYILLRKTPRNTTGHGREEGEKYRMLIE